MIRSKSTGAQAWAGIFYVAVFIIYGVPVVVSSVSSHAAEPEEIISQYFSLLDKALTKIAAAEEAQSSSLKGSESYFEAQYQQHPQLATILRVNTKGKIVNEIIEGKAAVREFRDISRRPWFAQSAKKKEPYYGYMEHEGRHYLFWAKPLLRRTSKGKIRSAGAIAAKIDLEKCFNKTSKSLSVPLSVMLDNKAIYSALWEESFEYNEIDPGIKGVPNISVRIKKTGPVAAQDSLQQTSSGIRAHPLFMPIVTVVLFIAFGILVFLARMISQMRNKALMAKVEGAKDKPAKAPKRKKKIVAPEPPPAKQESVAIAKPPPAPARAPSPEKVARSMTDTIRIEQEAVFEALQPQAPPEPAPTAPPPDAGSPANADPYANQQMNSEMYNQNVDSIAAELEKKYEDASANNLAGYEEQVRRRVQDEFGQKLEQYHNEISGALSEISNIVQALERNMAAHNQALNQAVTALRQKLEGPNPR
jgi:hypothetical protein